MTLHAAADDRRALRQRLRALRRRHAAASPLILAMARRELPALVPAGRHLGIYWPLAGEADLRPLATLALPLALPAVLAAEPASSLASVDAPGPARDPGPDPAARRLVYRPWRADDPVAPDACGIPAPLTPDLPPAALALLLVPALAFDPVSGIRLGYGGGFYDRLRADPAWRAVPALALLPSACLLHPLPAAPWDVPFAGWIDERGLHAVTPARPSPAV